MRKRLLSSIWQSQDICIFCTTRYFRGSVVSTGKTPQIRNYQSTQSAKRPAGAALAQKQDDEDENDFPLLRQNAGKDTTFNISSANQANAPATKQQITAAQKQTSIHTGNVTKRRPNADSPMLSYRPLQSNSSLSAQTQSSDRTPANFRHHARRNTPLQASQANRNGTEDSPTWSTSSNREPRQSQFQGKRFPDQSRKRNDGSIPIRYFGAEEREAPAPPQNEYQFRFDSRFGTESRYGNRNQQNSRGAFNSGPRGRLQMKPTPDDGASAPSNGEILTIDPELDSEVGPSIDLPAIGEAQGQRRPKQRRSRADRFILDVPETSAPRQQRAGSSDLDFELMEAEATLYGEKRGRKKKPSKQAVQATKPKIVLPDFIAVEKLAQLIKIKVDDLVQRLEEEGFEGARYDHILDCETSSMFADIYGFEVVNAEAGPIQDLVARPLAEDITNLPTRPPIVTIMGHVDHGKTTILDYLRKASVAAGEHGGITQHIGAFSVIMPGSARQITFLDTPGHEAFLDMRRRGANVTDIVVLVVAADDSVKPQTVEAIKHALDARVQIIIAINKVDKDDANIERVKQDLTRHDIVVEDYGGEYQAIPVSGKTGQGMTELEDAILTLSDVLDLRAEQDGQAEGTIIESKVTNAGRVATILVRRGTLRPGDFVVAGNTWARVRTLRNDSGQLVEQALPGDPVQVDGWRGADPTAGLEVLQAEDEQHAKDVIDLRLEIAETAQATVDMTAINAARTQEAEARAKVLAWEAENSINPRRRRENEGWVDHDISSGPKNVHFLIKADVAGSVEALVAAVCAIGNHEIRANVIHSGTGPVTESDIRMLATSGESGYAISFNQPVDGQMYRLAEAAGLAILDHNIIYKVTDDVKLRVEDALPPSVTQRVLGEAEIGKIFDVTVKKKKIRIAGCRVTNGTISRTNKVRVVRGGETVYTGQLESLKNVKKDVNEMRKGTECGIGFEEWEDFQEGDQVQCFEEKEEKRKLY